MTPYLPVARHYRMLPGDKNYVCLARLGYLITDTRISASVVSTFRRWQP